MDIGAEASRFSADVQALLDAVLPGDRVVQAVESGDRFVVRTDPDQIPLTVKGEKLARLRISISCCADSSGDFLAVASSAFVLSSVLDRTPLVRMDYERNMYMAPKAHWQFHAERGAFSHLLAHADTKAPHDLSSLHVPVGGSRYRPCLEDFLQFVVQECGVDSNPGWRTAVEDGRERWRLLQACTAVRDAPESAASVLRDLGYKVDPPDSGPAPTNHEALRRW